MFVISGDAKNTAILAKSFKLNVRFAFLFRRGEKWDPEAAAKNKEEAERLAKMEEEERAEAKKNKEKFIPKKENYHSKYEHLIGKDVAVDGAKSTAAVRRPHLTGKNNSAFFFLKKNKKIPGLKLRLFKISSSTFCQISTLRKFGIDFDSLSMLFFLGENFFRHGLGRKQERPEDGGRHPSRTQGKKETKT